MSPVRISTLRPGLLVGLSTEVKGNVSYARRDVQPDHLTAEGTRRATWETDREVNNPAEYERAIVLRSKARSLVTSMCTGSKFGLLCPEENKDKLLAAVDEARALADEFNAEATITRVGVFVIVGYVAQDDVRAVQAINSELRDLMSAMDYGLQRLDVAAVREAADKARALSSMLSPEAAERAKEAIAAARSAARRIVKAGEAAAYEIDEATLRTIRQSRAAFLDLEDAQEVAEPTHTGRAIDLEPTDLPLAAAPAPTAPAIEI